MTKIIFSVFARSVIVAVAFTGGCPHEPPFPGGIRMEANEALFDSPSAKVPVGNVGDFGTLTFVVGPGSGNQETFLGFTDPVTGIDDHPNAQTNANWAVAFDYTPSPIPACGVGTQSGFVPTQGAVFEETCLI
jgi:hypothetical protein